MDRVQASEAWGRGFESRAARQLNYYARLALKKWRCPAFLERLSVIIISEIQVEMPFCSIRLNIQTLLQGRGKPSPYHSYF